GVNTWALSFTYGRSGTAAGTTHTNRQDKNWHIGSGPGFGTPGPLLLLVLLGPARHQGGRVAGVHRVHPAPQLAGAHAHRAPAEPNAPQNAGADHGADRLRMTPDDGSRLGRSIDGILMGQQRW